jgi:uncharacterized protein
MTAHEAASQIGTQLLRELPRESKFFAWKWEEVVDSIRSQAKGVIGSKLIHIFAETGSQEPMQLLLEKGADIELKTDMEWTALLVAVSAGNQTVVQMLLEKGANINSQNFHGQSSLMLAALRCNISMVRLLVENRANIHLRDSRGARATDFTNDSQIRDYLENRHC